MFSWSDSRKRSIAYLAVLGLLACLRFVSLGADFPIGLGSYGMAYTDEGWWSRNAIAWVKEGSWYIDDGYNTITNLPVLPIIQVVWFKLFGISLISARAITVVCSLLVSGWVYLFARRELSIDLAWIAPFIVLTNYPTFAYNRLALLEMPMLVFLLASLWLATTQPQRAGLNTAASGLLFTLAVLTKTTALFALPVIAIALFSQTSSNRVKPDRVLSQREKIIRAQPVRRQINWTNPIPTRYHLLLIWLLSVGFSLGLYCLIVNQAGDPQSQAYFSNHNVTAKVPKGFFAFLKGPARVIKHSLTLYPLLFPGLIGAIVLLAKAGKTQSSPLFKILVLWTGAALCAFSLSDYAAPRYFVTLIVPIALAIPLWLESVFNNSRTKSQTKSQTRSQTRSQTKGQITLMLSRQKMSLVSGLLILACSISTGLSLFHISDYLWRPQFTLIETASAIDQYIEIDKARSNVVLGSFSDTLALTAKNIKAVNERMGFRPLAYRLETFDPGYYVSIGPVGTSGRQFSQEIQSTLENNYRLVLLDKFELFQRRDYNQPVFFYRLDSR